MRDKKLHRREVVAGLAAAPLLLVGLNRSSAANRTCAVTADNIEGPFFKPGAPSRAVLAGPRTRGRALLLSGRVLDTGCRPIAGVELDVWHADHRGDYDNRGFDFRARLVTDARGHYAIRTIVPGRYRLDRTRYRPAHIHVKLRAKGFRPLTTQLYFPGDPFNAGDPFLVRSLIMNVRNERKLARGTFDFVLKRR